ncbi:hypothetical protein [Mesorhizobium sp. J8]|uniref:hypothetical protein n=1 Tax=Mesorhizobium sp. J8 TaxID=2777475 RepID=UPI001915DBB2|nr:hypothetical protein [Mesorhizobium sp. J8]BCM19381.1 hypothetical protein MJ8_31540 [Mesorhizobium sp. J8]
MTTVIWICCCGLVLIAVSYLGVFVNSISIPLNGPSGRRFLKKAVKKRGVDPNRIPDRVWWEIVEGSIATATLNGNFRAEFAWQLNREADAIARIMSGTTNESQDHQVRNILVRNGVIAPY